MPADTTPRCCGNCLHYGTRNYGDRRACTLSFSLPSLKGKPSCLKLTRQMMRATDGQDCPAFQPKEPNDAE